MSYSKRHLVLALLAGLVLGLLTARLTRLSRRHIGHAKHVELLSRKLDLTAEQKDKVAAAFEKGRAAIDEARLKTRSDIKAVLTPAQTEKFEKMMERRDRKRGAPGERR